jgi:glycosyltransferase involved in cell wall biosynthesis
MALNIPERRHILRRALEQVDRVLIGSESARRLFHGAGVSRAIDVVRYGHDLRWLEGYRGKSPSVPVRFGFIGRLAPMKGPHILVEAFVQAFRVGEAKLLLYGSLEKDPQFLQRLRALTGGRKDIEFRGTYTHADSGRVFSEIDVLVVPSLWHDYPLVIGEAFAARTPVIASDFGGMSEFVRDGVDGLLFQRGSVAGLVRQMRRILSDAGLLATLQTGVPSVKSMTEAAGEMERIYTDVLSARYV